MDVYFMVQMFLRVVLFNLVVRVSSSGEVVSSLPFIHPIHRLLPPMGGGCCRSWLRWARLTLAQNIPARHIGSRQEPHH
ncbi:hypothetical protein E2C01_037469 [Portunus trituberculatus]|uniref:Secreted protein n=1 Tax=Portunus trituberculatus TaxID=210409 RepID=A0A5B7FEP6_PORTR|nr:hypothetical protein [Portunus trituberculatus]